MAESRGSVTGGDDIFVVLRMDDRFHAAVMSYSGQNHRGVGLSITRILAKESSGQLSIASEDGWFDEVHGLEQTRLRQPIFFPGTLVAVSLHRDQIADYAAMHAKAMAEIGMGDLDAGSLFID